MKHTINLQIPYDGWLTLNKKNFWFKTILNTAQITLSCTEFKNICSINFLLESEIYLQHLNATHRGQNKSTNLLSFPNYSEEDLHNLGSSAIHLGDIALSLQNIQREVLLYKKNFMDHFTHLVVHGILHLQGFDHQSIEQSQIMESLELEILQNMNIPNPYYL